MRFVCQTSDMSIIYRFIAFQFRFNTFPVHYFYFGTYNVPSICDATATIYYFICMPYVLHVYSTNGNRVEIITANANGIRYNGLAVKLEINDALQLNSFNIEFNSALKTQ